ncbi:MAG TPA: CHAT domain-containing protein [Bacteroidota bacterium]|nr:CHAT domain-containing protein [Bacteroidota bacterium]
MSRPSPLLQAAAGITVALLGCTGCGTEQSPEQLRADSAFTSGNAAILRDDYRAAKEHIFAALALDEGLNRRTRVAEETRLLGDIASAGASFDSALEWYARSSGEFRALADRSGVRDITLRVAALRRTMGEERKAFTMYVEALRLARVFHDDEGVRDIQWAMLPCVRSLDEKEQESDILRELLQGYTAAGDVGHQAAVFLARGDGEFALRSFDRGAEEYLRALMLADQARDSLLAVRSVLRLAMASEGAGRLRDALTNFGECLKRADRTRGAAEARMEALIRVGNLYLRGRQFAEAVRFFRAALSAAHASGNTLTEGYLLLQMGNCDAESSRESALRNYKAGMDLCRESRSGAGMAYSSLCMGNLFLKNNQPTDALQYFKRGIEQSESVAASRPDDDLLLACEQAYFGARRTPLYDEVIDILLRLGRYDEAFWYADRRNNWELHAVLGALDAQPRNDTLRALLDVYRDARAREIGAERRCLELAKAGGGKAERAASARTEQEKAFAAMNEAAEAVARKGKPFEPFVRIASVGLTEVGKALPPGTALVEHILTRRSLYAFVVTGARSGVYVSAFEKDRVFDLSREFIDLLRLRETYADSTREQQTPLEARLRELNSPLYEAFIQPIEGAIAGVPDLNVVLPTEVAGLPLHALARGAQRPGGYLAEGHAVSYLPSASSVMLPRAAGARIKEVVGLGCPGGTSWDVEYELRDIRAFYKDVRLYFEAQASLATLQKEHEDLLHLALRFSFNDPRPGNSFFMLSDGESAESMKRTPLGELLSLPPVSAVVVSDLDEQRLGIRPAEPYLFLANGTPQVVFTSMVPSRKAKKFFGEIFYTALLAGGDVRTAFRKAQLEMIKTGEYASPCTWSPFFLWGR